MVALIINETNGKLIGNTLSLQHIIYETEF